MSCGVLNRKSILSSLSEQRIYREDVYQLQIRDPRTVIHDSRLDGASEERVTLAPG